MAWLSSRRTHIACCSILLVLVVPLASVAQTFRGGISGIVTDPSGAAVPGAIVKGTESATRPNGQSHGGFASYATRGFGQFL